MNKKIFAKIYKISRSAQLQLSNISKMTNDVYNMQLLTFTFTIMIYIIIHTYYIYEEIQRTTNVKKLLQTLIIFVWNSFGNFIKIIYIGYYCECTINEVRNCIYRFYKLEMLFFFFSK